MIERAQVRHTQGYAGMRHDRFRSPPVGNGEETDRIAATRVASGGPGD